MPGLERCLLLLLLAVVAPALSADTREMPTVIGSAYDQDTGHLLYTEYHFCPGDRQRCTVQYRDSYGELIAQKNLDFSRSPIAPSLTLVDYRRDHSLRVTRNEPTNLVVDAGFDNFVRSIWDELEGGKTARFPFLVAGFDRPFKMRAARAELPDCSHDQLCLEISMDSWFLGLLASPIELSYSREDRSLLRFSGVSNMKGENGETLEVDIFYAYGDELLLAGPWHRKSTEYTF